MSKHVLVKDNKTGKLIRKTKRFPKSQWRYKEVKELCIIDDDKLWDDTQKRLDAVAEAWSGPGTPPRDFMPPDKPAAGSDWVLILSASEGL